MLVRRIVGWILEHELTTLLLLLVTGMGIWTFIEIADEVLEGDSHRFDKQILLSLRTVEDRADPLGPSWLEEAARDVTGLGSVAVLTIVAITIGGYLLCTKRRWVALFLGVSIVGGVSFASLLKSGFDRPRPELVPHQTEIFTKSFPSGHASMSAIVFLTAGAIMARTQSGRRTKGFLIAMPLLVTILVGVTRVYLGVHWPTDVLAGWSLGVTWAAASWLLFRFLERRYRLPTAATPA